MKQITFEELSEWMDSGKSFQLIDVREPHEHAAFNIGGTLMPLSELFQHAGSLKEDLPVVVYCEKGIRSMIAIQRLSPRLPDTEFFNLKSGVWQLKLKG